jgi:hypothetical protein
MRGAGEQNMIGLLEKAFAEASKLPAAEQEALAAWLLEELAGERRWETALSSSREGLERLADQALKEHSGRQSRPLDLERM